MGRTLKTRHLPQYKKDVLYPENLDIADAVNKNELPTSQEQNPRKTEKDIRGVDNNNDDLSCRSDFPCEQISTSNPVVIPIVEKRKYPLRHRRQIKVQKTDNRHFGQEVCGGVKRYDDGEDRSNEKATKALAVMVPKKLRPTRQIENGDDEDDDDNTFYSIYDGIKRRKRRNTRQTLKTNI